MRTPTFLSKFAALAFPMLFVSLSALAAPPAFRPLASFPAVPAEGAYGVTADALGDGRFLVYDGSTVLVQDLAGIDRFSAIAAGYTGDPGFVAVAPDGHTALLGAGFSGALWLLDVWNPNDAAAPVASAPHYEAEWLTDSLVLIDSATLIDAEQFVFEADLSILDLAAAPPVLRVVVDGGRGASASVTLSSDLSTVYASDGLTGETRSFSREALIAAYESDMPLHWLDGAFLGVYNTGGVFDCSPQGTLFVGGFSPTTYEGSIQIVDPATGAVREDFTLTENPYSVYDGALSPTLGRILIVGTDWPGPSIQGFQSDTGFDSQVRPVFLFQFFVQGIVDLIMQIIRTLFSGFAL